MTPAPNRPVGLLGQLWLLLLMVLPWALLILIGGSKLMFAPPHTSDTITLYIVLLTAGLVTLQIPVILHRVQTGKTGCLRPLLLAVMGFVMMVIVLGLFGPLLEAASGISTVNCPPETFADGRVSYVCSVPIFDGAYVYTLEGSKGSPFVQVVESNLTGS